MVAKQSGSGGRRIPPKALDANRNFAKWPFAVTKFFESDVLQIGPPNLIALSLAVRKMRYVPMTPKLAGELRQMTEVEDGPVLPLRAGAVGSRRRLEGSFEDLLNRAKIRAFRLHDLRHTFASWYMMNGGDLYELAKILGHSNIKMTKRYAKLGRQHLAKTGNTATEMWKLLEPLKELAQCSPMVPAS